MSNFNNDDYVNILNDCVPDIYYSNSSYRSKIAQTRQYAEVIVRKLIDYDSRKEFTLGKKEVKDKVSTLKFGSHFNKCIHAIKDNDNGNFHSANACCHSQELSQITQQDYENHLDKVLDLLSCLFINYFSRYPFGSNSNIMSAFSLAPPILRYKVLSFLYSQDNTNDTINEKLAIATLKVFGAEEAKEWVHNNNIANAAMLDFKIDTLKKINPLYKTFEEAKSFYNRHKPIFETDEEEVKEFLQLMDFIYIGRKDVYSTSGCLSSK